MRSLPTPPSSKKYCWWVVNDQMKDEIGDLTQDEGPQVQAAIKGNWMKRKKSFSE